jgi:glycine dehydrogenase subunit 1
VAKRTFVHPYIPNSVPEVRAEMLKAIGAKDAEELYSEMIPQRLRLKRAMRMPEPIVSEHDLKRHVEQALSKNRTGKDNLIFMGGGCAPHHVPAVCDEIARRAEFLTAYSGEYYSDLGRFQAYFEFQSLIGELVGMDVACVPTYDWGTAAGHAARMASRLTRRKEMVFAGSVSPGRRSIMQNFCGPAAMRDSISVKSARYDSSSGTVDIEDLKLGVSKKTACVYMENPSYLGTIEADPKAVAEIAHDCGALFIVGVDPISLGVLAPPSEYGADLVCGDIQSLGVHMHCGGGLGGFIASGDDERYVAEYPLHLVSVAGTAQDGERGFGYCRFDRTSYVLRDKAKDWVGTSSGLWSIVSAVYLSLMGPQGMKEVGEAILQKSHYASARIARIRGLKVRFPNFFKEFVVNYDGADSTVAKVNRALVGRGMFGGIDLTRGFPELGQSALYCVTEVHSKDDIDRLIGALKAVVA